MINEVFDITRVALCFIFFGYASISDLKKREVSNKVWAIMAPLVLAPTLLQFILFFPQELPLYGISFAITAALSFVLFYAGAFGGADAKALMCLALALPIFPSNFFQLNVPRVSPIFPLTVFSNSVLLAALTVVYSVFRNLSWRLRTGKKLFEGFERETIWKKLVAMLTGYKVKIASLTAGFMLPLEDIKVSEGGSEERRLIVMPNDEERDKIVERILNAQQKRNLQNEVWATPGLPLLVFITFGLAVSLAVGDLIWILLSLLFR